MPYAQLHKYVQILQNIKMQHVNLVSLGVPGAAHFNTGRGLVTLAPTTRSLEGGGASSRLMNLLAFRLNDPILASYSLLPSQSSI